MITDAELRRMWTKAVTAYFKVLPNIYLKVLRKNSEKTLVRTNSLQAMIKT
jgi:hypothetical protein